MNQPNQQRNQDIIDAIFFSGCFAIHIDRRQRIYRTCETLNWFVIDGECSASGDYFQSVMQASNWDQVIARFKHIRKTATCINVDRFTEEAARNYGVPYLLEEKNYVDLGKYLGDI